MKKRSSKHRLETRAARGSVPKALAVLDRAGKGRLPDKGDALPKRKPRSGR